MIFYRICIVIIIVLFSLINCEKSLCCSCYWFLRKITNVLLLYFCWWFWNPQISILYVDGEIDNWWKVLLPATYWKGGRGEDQIVVIIFDSSCLAGKKNIFTRSWRHVVFGFFLRNGYSANIGTSSGVVEGLQCLHSYSLVLAIGEWIYGTKCEAVGVGSKKPTPSTSWPWPKGPGGLHCDPNGERCSKHVPSCLGVPWCQPCSGRATPKWQKNRLACCGQTWHCVPAK